MYAGNVANRWPDLETRFASLFRAPFLTPTRVRVAYAIGVTTGVLQFVLGPLRYGGECQGGSEI